MKIRYLIRSAAGVLIAALLTLSQDTLAQTSTTDSVPIVTVQATDPLATWTGDTGTFTFFRAGNPEPALNVYCCISGTASNGMDYKSISHLVQLDSGVMSNNITISPIDLGQTDVKTVTLELCPSPLEIPVNYEVGSPSNATVYIAPESKTNLPPFVQIVEPANGATFYGHFDCPPCTANNPPCMLPCGFAGPDIVICANALDVDGYVNTVEFFANGMSLGIRTNCPACASPVNPFCLVWTNVPPGNYSLTALATDHRGATNTSDAISITVSDVPPPTNLPPEVRIVSPTNGTVFYDAPAEVGLFAKANDADGFVTNVEFFAGDMDLGSGNLLVLDPPGVNGVVGPIYFLSWKNVPGGSYSLTAVASDDFGATNRSDAVSITVSNGPPPPPPTNLPPVVRITSPHDGAVFFAPIHIPLYAYAHAADWIPTVGFDQVTNVEFYADGIDLGHGHHVEAGPPPGEPMPLSLRLLPYNFLLLWSNAPVGLHLLTAVALDKFGNSATSTPVRIGVMSSLPPPPNRPPLVSIVASDPIAIKGTNCWPWLGLSTTNATWSAWITNGAYRFFTNCGPKNATFTVRRRGDTNADLTIAYAIGGSASNSVDYVALPGVVTIPAGERSAIINIVPLEGGPPDITSTVVLKLLSDTNSMPAYLPFPQITAAAIIIGDPLPKPVTGFLPGRYFHFAAPGPDGAWFHIESSTDLLHWTSVCTNQIVNGSIDFVDPDSANGGSRFYRTVPEDGPPPE